MSTNGEKASLIAATLIQDQLRTLPITIAALTSAYAEGSDVLQHLNGQIFKRKLRLVTTGSGGNIVAESASLESVADSISATALTHTPHAKIEALRVVVSNALLAVGFYLKEHEMESMRTPEIQFLGHIVQGILNENTFKLHAGYRPTAAFDGLVIESKLDGMAVFADGNREGFIELGDAIALLQWLARYLSGEKNYVSGGDAG